MPVVQFTVVASEALKCGQESLAEEVLDMRDYM